MVGMTLEKLLDALAVEGAKRGQVKSRGLRSPPMRPRTQTTAISKALVPSTSEIPVRLHRGPP
jgi:hypothetical protein